jgi:D-alanyl-D-alanine carboxypeptidase
VHRGDRRIVAVLLGGTSSSARDARMRSLIEENMADASSHRASPIALPIDERKSDAIKNLYALPVVRRH